MAESKNILISIVVLTTIVWLIDLEALPIHDINLRRPDRETIIGKQQGQRALISHVEDFFGAKTTEATSLFHRAIIADEDATSSTSSKFIAEEHAIFLISFGESAAKSSFLERSILAIRRRGEFDGPVAVLTDAPEDRYEALFDENVALVRPNKVDTQIKFHFDVVRYKRFKTLLLDYLDLIPAFKNVKWVYYMDLDILMARPFVNLISGLDRTYHYQHSTSSSNLFFFRSCSKNYYANSGFFIMSRNTSRPCLKLWQDELESNSDRYMDQYSLNRVFRSIENEERIRRRVSSCHLHVMEHENYLAFVKTNEDMNDVMETSPENYPSLIHPFNSAVGDLDVELYEEFVADVVGLTEVEKRETNLASVAEIRPSKTFSS